MCGIVGVVLKRRAASRADVDAMNATILHRGPDGDGVFLEGPVGLGMRRLSIIDLEGGWQPIPNETGRIQVLQNGEIYNYRELRRELEGKGHRFRTHSDTEAAVHAYEEWGGFDFAKHLRGMFAISIWDREKQELWLVRDRIGIKPLYFAQTDEGFAFASETKALLAGPVVKPVLEPRAIAQYLTYGSAGIEDSFVKGVHQLRPGCALRLRGADITVRPYWTFRFPEKRLELSEEEACEALRARLEEAVKAHLVSDVPVGAFLSGGIDSSAVVGLMAKAGARDFCTFSIGFQEERFNELPYARLVAQRYGSRHSEEIVRPDALALVEKIGHHLDEPFADASAVPTWYVSELAARHVKVVLSGDGGDELFAGYQRYADIRNHAWLDSLPRPLRKLGRLLARPLPQAFPGKYFLDYAAGDAAERYVYNLHLFPPPLQRRLLLPEWTPQALGAQDPAEDWRREMEADSSLDPVERAMRLDLLRYLPLDILIKVDRMAMAHSLEARPPLLDHEFVEFAASLPLPMKMAPDGRRKHVFKRAAEPLLPPELMTRPKAGFSVPLQQWFAGPLRPRFEDEVLAGGRSLEYLRAPVLRQLLAENATRRRDHGLKLWAVLMLEQWLRRLPGIS